MAGARNSLGLLPLKNAVLESGVHTGGGEAPGFTNSVPPSSLYTPLMGMNKNTRFNSFLIVSALGGG